MYTTNIALTYPSEVRLHSSPLLPLDFIIVFPNALEHEASIRTLNIALTYPSEVRLHSEIL